MRISIGGWGGFIPKLRAMSVGELHSARRVCVWTARFFGVLALVFFGAVIWGMLNNRLMALTFGLAVLEIMAGVVLQIKVWFIDLVVGEKTMQTS